MYVALKKLYSELPIVVNTDRIVTIESTSFPPGACRINGTLLVEGPLEEVLKKLNGKDDIFAKAVARVYSNKTKRLRKPKSKGVRNEQS